MLQRTYKALMLLGALGLLCGPLSAATVVVGSCLPAYPHFSTIQTAINASPLGGTVMVCPGTYPEQISIFHPLTLKGVDTGSSDMALITMPTGGIGAQIYVQATGVYISDLTIDGSNNGATTCGQGPYGIYYFDSSGTINHVATRNQYPTGPGLACFDPSGVVVASNNVTASVVTIENSSIHGFQGEGAWAFGQGSSMTLIKNSIGGNANGNGSNGIAVTGGATAVISNNSVMNILEPVSYPNIYGAGFGALIQCSQGVVMKGNNFGDVQVGVYIDSTGCTTGNGDSNTLNGNTFSQTHIFDAVYVCGNYNLVESNTINSTSEAAIRFDSSCNPGISGYFNTFISNTVNEACTVALTDPAVSSQNTVGSNTWFNISHDQLSGTVLPSGFCSSSGAPAASTRQTSTRRGARILPSLLEPPPHGR